MTHIENVAHILQNGITHRNSPRRNENYVPIGDGSLISARNAFLAPTGRALGDYTPFYLGTRMPMLYVIQKGHNGVSRVFPDNIVYCVTSVERIISAGLEFVFTDGHAVDALTQFFDLNDVERLSRIVDWKAVNAKYWRDENDLDLKRRKEAEFLVLGDLPVSAIEGFIVFSVSAGEQIRRMRRYNNQAIDVNPNCYF